MSTRTLRDAEHLLVLLAHEMSVGRGDDPEADRLRDALDEPLRQCSPQERATISELSADLYLVEGSRRPQPLAAGETLKSVIEAVGVVPKRDGRVLLRLLRKIPLGTPALPDDVIAWGYGRSWERLGFHAAAAAFFDFAASKKPDGNYALLALEALQQARLFAELDKRIALIEQAAAPQPSLLFKAAAVVFQRSAEVALDKQPAEFERVVKLVARVDPRIKVLASVRAAGMVAAGFSYDHLGKHDEALKAFDQAIADTPTDAVYVARGFVHADHGDRDKALKDFRAALQQGTSLVWPYFYLAHDALTRQDWKLTESIASTGTAHTKSGALRAKLFEWNAIAAAMLGRPDATVRALFNFALGDDPVDETIRANLDAFEKARQARSKVEWLPTTIDLQEARSDFESAFRTAA